MKRVLLTRAATAFVAVLVVVSVTFAGLALSPDPNLQGRLWQMQRHGASDDELDQFREQYLEAHQLSRGSLTERYVAWLWAFATLDLGRSATLRAPVNTVLLQRIPITLSYFLPGLGLAVVVNLFAGVWAGRRRNSRPDRFARLVVYAALGVPSFWIVLMIYAQFGDAFSPRSSAVARFSLAALLVAFASSAAVFQHVRAKATEYYATDATRLLRASGAGRLTLLRHAVRNLAGSLASLVFAEAVSVLVVTVYIVEFVLRIDGIGTATLLAIHGRDVPLVVGIVFVFAVMTATGNLVLDLLRAVLDPRISAE